MSAANRELQAALDAAAAERDPYTITQRTPYREREVDCWRCIYDSGTIWLAGPWMPRGWHTSDGER
jgi:hypothetical protein